jgi:NADH-quinone oxidoreductase subunit J
MTPGLFVGFGALLLASAVMVVLHKNPVTSALFLVLSFCSLAGIYLLLQAEFIGFVQIIVYAGAIMVLFLFVIMYLNLQHDIEHGAHIALRRGIGWMVGALLLLFAAMLMMRGWAPGPIAPPANTEGGNAALIGRALYSRFLFPFEVTSMLLLVAMVGAIVMTRGRRGETEDPLP